MVWLWLLFVALNYYSLFIDENKEKRHPAKYVGIRSNFFEGRSKSLTLHEMCIRGISASGGCALRLGLTLQALVTECHLVPAEPISEVNHLKFR